MMLMETNQVQRTSGLMKGSLPCTLRYSFTNPAWAWYESEVEISDTVCKSQHENSSGIRLEVHVVLR